MRAITALPDKAIYRGDEAVRVSRILVVDTDTEETVERYRYEDGELVQYENIVRMESPPEDVRKHLARLSFVLERDPESELLEECGRFVH